MILRIILTFLACWGLVGLGVWLHYIRSIFPLTTRDQPRWFRCLVAVATLLHAIILGPVALALYTDPRCL